MRAKALVSKGTLTRMRAQVQQAWDRRDLSQCIEILERITRMEPTNTWAFCKLGQMHGLMYDYKHAEEYFERAYKLAPPGNKVQILAEAGQLTRNFYDTSVAEKYFDRLVREKGVTAGMLISAAELAERNRRMDQATDLVARALQLEDQNPAALLARAHLEHRAGNHEKAEQELKPLLQLNVQPDVRIKAWYETGAVLDRLGRYDEAMKAFLQAKALLRYKGGPYLKERLALIGRYAQLRENLTADVLERWYRVGNELMPPRRLGLLGGHPRSGTTLLEQVLDAHPDVVSMEETENFANYVGMPLCRLFDVGTPLFKVFDSAAPDLLTTLRADYWKASEACLGAPVGGRLLIDKHPSLTLSIPAIVRVFPETRLLIALRDPRDVLMSCFMQPFLPVQMGNAAFLGLDTATAEYAALMGMWLKLKPILPNRYLEVRYEDMVEDLESVARKVLDFLGVPWDERVLEFDAHARSKRVRSPTYADVTQKVFKRAKGRWRNYEKYLEPHLPKLEPFLKAFGYE